MLHSFRLYRKVHVRTDCRFPASEARKWSVFSMCGMSDYYYDHFKRFDNKHCADCDSDSDGKPWRLKRYSRNWQKKEITHSVFLDKHLSCTSIYIVWHVGTLKVYTLTNRIDGLLPSAQPYHSAKASCQAYSESKQKRRKTCYVTGCTQLQEKDFKSFKKNARLSFFIRYSLGFPL